MHAIREGDDKRFIDLVDIVEKGCRDLLRVGIEREISNTSPVSKDIRREWSREVNRTNSKVEESNKSPYLPNFLLEQKRTIEYESMSLRTGGAPIKGYASHLDEDDGNSNAIKMSKQSNGSLSFNVGFTINMLLVNARYILGNNWRTKLQL